MSHAMSFTEIVNRLGGGELHTKLEQAERLNQKTVRLMTIQEGPNDKLNGDVLQNKAVIRLQQMIDGRHGRHDGSFWAPVIGEEKIGDNHLFYIYAELHQKEYQKSSSSG